MCNHCGCSGPHNAQIFTNRPHIHTVSTQSRLLHDNDQQAAHNREHFKQHQVLVINLMSAPGSGKTALLEATIVALKDTCRLAVIEGDLETENDAERIRAHGVPAVQITTGSACHLDAAMIHSALHQLDMDSLDILFIENVGNLICPASFDLGQHSNVTLLAVTEGSDKPAKYPVMFRATDLVLFSKSDLLGIIDDFDPILCESYIRKLANAAPIIQLSSRTGIGIVDWVNWLQQNLPEPYQYKSTVKNI